MSKPWTEAEDDIIREKYPRYGTCCSEHLPGRTTRAIVTRASNIGVLIENVRSPNKPLKGGTRYTNAKASAIKEEAMEKFFEESEGDAPLPNDY